MSELKILELFGGIGACTKALERQNIPHKVVDYVEIDKYAVKSYNAVHGTDFEPQDILTWDKDIECDLIMHGSPCQDFSVAGLQLGGDKDSGTRSSLMYETLRIVEKLKPKYVIWENVKNLISKKHRHNFDAYLEAMEKIGYKNHYQVLNAKNYGIPQNRERVFTVSIRLDVPYCWAFEFPEPMELTKTLGDMLEEEVDEKYYISFGQVDKLPGAYGRNFGSKGKIQDPNGIQSTLQAAMGVGGGNVPLVPVTPDVSYCLDANYHKGTTVDGYLKKKRRQLVTVASRGRYDDKGKIQQHLEPRKDGLTNTITSVQKDNLMADGSDYRIRKLTPKECWRLMGFDDADFEKAEKVNSNTQLYKQAGNSIVVNVLEGILSNLIGEKR